MLYIAYVDEFGHIGPYISRDHARHNDSPVFGLAGFVLPSSQVRGFGSHNLTVEGLDIGTDTIQAGNTTTISFTPEEPGTYDIVCTVPGHSQAGMTGDLVVTE